VGCVLWSGLVCTSRRDQQEVLYFVLVRRIH